MHIEDIYRYMCVCIDVYVCIYIIYINTIIFLFTQMLTYYYSTSYFHLAIYCYFLLTIYLENHSMLVHKKLPCSYGLMDVYCMDGMHFFFLSRSLLMDIQVATNLLFSLTMINVVFCLFFTFKFISCFYLGLDISTKN